MSGLDRLYRLEIEFHRRFRAERTNALEAASIPSATPCRNRYEPLLRTIGVVNPADLVRATERVMGRGRPARDVRAACHSLRQLVRGA